ncbi:MAG: ComF family protein [Armatimonadetes bacterium]|nr:ComF family protein [Armatimonadota bacterium]
MRSWWHAALDLAFPPRCHVCGAACGGVLCPACIAAFPVARAVCQRCGLPFAETIAADAALATADLIVPVPLHAARLRARGFNQAEEIAVVAGERLGEPVSTSLVRTRETAPQSSWNAAGRSQNLGGAFAAPTPLRGHAPWLIDDVVTTGATLGSCDEALIGAGAGVVLAASVARTPRPR